MLADDSYLTDDGVCGKLRPLPAEVFYSATPVDLGMRASWGIYLFFLALELAAWRAMR